MACNEFFDLALKLAKNCYCRFYCQWFYAWHIKDNKSLFPFI